MGRMILNLPRLGETMEEARVTTWIVGPNVAFKRGDVLLEVETDKTVVEVPALQDGVMLAHLVREGDTVALEAPIAEIESAKMVAPVAIDTEPATPLVASAQVSMPLKRVPQTPSSPSSAVAASPAARFLARELGQPLDGISGTGRRGRISANDVRGNGYSKHKPIVLLLHGLFDNHRGWRDLPKRLLNAGFEVANIDLPGHGDSLPAAEDFDDAVKIITQYVVKTLSGKNVIIVGHSIGAALGACVADALQRQRTNTVEGLLMLAPAGLGARINADFIDGMRAASNRAAVKKCYDLLGTGPLSDAVLDEELRRILALRPKADALVRSVVQNGFQQIDIQPVLMRLKIPVTAIFGLKDEIIDWQHCKALPHNHAVHFIHDAGHLPHMSSPDFICRLVAGFAAGSMKFNNEV